MAYRETIRRHFWWDNYSVFWNKTNLFHHWPVTRSLTSQSWGQSHSHARDRKPAGLHLPPQCPLRTEDRLRDTGNNSSFSKQMTSVVSPLGKMWLWGLHNMLYNGWAYIRFFLIIIFCQDRHSDRFILMSVQLQWSTDAFTSLHRFDFRPRSIRCCMHDFTFNI